jgi:N-acetylglucosamine malate deacetylase 1
MRFGKKSRIWLLAIVIVIALFTGLFYHEEIPVVAAQSAAGKLSAIGAAGIGQKVIVFSPHPDDESIAAGGYIAQSIINGALVTIVLVTDGNAQHNEAIRYNEFEKATSVLGVTEVNLVFLGFPDGKLVTENQAALQASLQIQIDNYNPDIVVYPNPRDYNLDHKTIGQAIDKILKKESRHMTAYEYLVHYELIYPRPREFAPADNLLPPKRLANVGTQWLRFNLSSSIESCKEKAVFTYQSQLHSPELDGLMHSFIRKNELFSISKFSD